MDKKIFNLINWFEGKKAPPYILELRPTSRCNLKCISCGQSKQDGLDEISEEKLTNLIQEASSIGVSRLEVCGGGEPLMRTTTLTTIMLLAKKLGMEGCLTTNGTLFTEDIVKNLVAVEWDEILLSLDGPDAETHDYLRQTKGCFNKVIKSLKLFKKWKKKLNKTKPVIKLVPVLNNKNYDKLKRFMEIAKSYNLMEVRFQPLYAFTKPQDSLKLSHQDIKKLPLYVEEAQTLAKEYNIDTNVGIFLKELFTGRSLELYQSDVKSRLTLHGPLIKNPFLSAPCFFPWFYIGVNYDGATIPCPAFDIHTAKKIGDKHLLDMWYDKTFENLRGSILKKKLHPHCKRCCGGLIINNRDIRRQLHSYTQIQHMNFSDLVSRIDDVEQKIRKDEHVQNLEKGLADFKNSLIFKIGSGLEKLPPGKLLKYLNKKWTKKHAG